MLTFKQFVTELASEDVTLSPAEMRETTARFGDKVLQMGHVEQDGSMLVPVDLHPGSRAFTRNPGADRSRRKLQ